MAGDATAAAFPEPSGVPSIGREDRSAGPLRVFKGTTMLRWLSILLVVLAAVGAPAAADAGTWSPAVSIPVAGPGAFEPGVAIGADGSEVVVWIDQGGVESAVRPAGEATFDAGQNVAPPPSPGGAVSRLEVVQVPGAETIALWSRADAGLAADRIEWSARPPGGAFGPIHLVPTT